MQSGVALDPPFNGIATAEVVDTEQLETLQMCSSGLQLKRADVARTATALYMGFEWARCRLPADCLCLICSSAEVQLEGEVVQPAYPHGAVNVTGRTTRRSCSTWQPL